MVKTLVFIAIVLFFATPSFARPVSYKGGLTFSTTNDGDSDAALFHYSFRNDSSIGWRNEYFRERKWLFSGAQWNVLVKRWNNTGSQANIYSTIT